MIPALVEAVLQTRYPGFEHRAHATAVTAQGLAAATHVSGRRVAKVVALRVDGELALAVIAATDRLNLAPLEEAIGARAELASEPEFSGRFWPCDAGAAPPLSMFGAPIFVDHKLMREQTLLMPAGTHEDAVALDTGAWAWGEHVQPIVGLGRATDA
ncbi:MAG TPA: YbaK/EbsC family protein [Anaeromyxobacteraceae bacterium]|nr:YbaK/EbsC family protein [Anaeromyxobacteraceae bacterium]